MGINYFEQDRELLKLFQSDSEKAVETLFNIYYAALCKRVNRIINNSVMAEDIIQDVFYTFWEKRDKININTSIGSYLNRMALNAAFTYIRKVKNVNIIELNDQIATSQNNAEEGGDEKYMFHEMQTKICSIIESLPPKCKLIFTMSRHEEMSNRQIAEHLSISVKTVENQMTKALRIFRTNLLVTLLIVSQIFLF